MKFTATLKNNGLISQAYRFIYSAYYPVLVSLWATCCFMLNLPVLGLSVMILLAGLVLIFIKDLSPLIPLIASCILTVRNYSVLTSVPCIVEYCLLGACFIYHFIRFPFKQFYLGKLFFPLCLVSAALFLGGTLSQQGLDRYADGLAVAFATGPALLIIYLIFINGIDAPKNTDLPLYVCYAILSATVCACTEILFVYLRHNVDFYPLTRSVGWGNYNTVGAMTLISIPICCFIAVKTKKFASMSSVIISMIATDIISGSDGSIGIAAFSLPFLIIFVLINVNAEYRKRLVLCISVIILLICVAGLILLYKFGFDAVSSFIIDKTNATGRFALYDKAIKIFRKNPVLGIGQGFYDESSEYLQTYNFHSTFFHVLATMGIFGIIAYFVYYFFRFKILLGKNSSVNTFAYFSFIMFEAYGLIDVCEFNILPLMTFITLIILTVELSNIKGEEKNLPLYGFLYR